jgi:hypothetical protein
VIAVSEATKRNETECLEHALEIDVPVFKRGIGGRVLSDLMEACKKVKSAAQRMVCGPSRSQAPVCNSGNIPIPYVTSAGRGQKWYLPFKSNNLITQIIDLAD